MSDSKGQQLGAVSAAVPRRTQLAILSALVIGVLLIWGTVSIVSALTARPPVVQPSPPPGTFQPTAQQWNNLTLAPVEARTFATSLDTDGKVATDDDVTTQVFSPFSGRVTKVFAKAGDRVSVGAPLFAVQATEFVQGQIDLVAAIAQLKVTRAAAARQEALLKIQGASVKDVQQAEADLANARAGLEAVKSRLRILGKSDAQIAALEQEPTDKSMASETVVSAPIAGVVTQRSVGVGQNIASVVNNGGGTPAFIVSDLRKVWLVANVREAEAGALRIGAPITAELTAFPGKVFTGQVSFIAPSIDPNTRRLAVHATLNNDGGLLRPEMFADVKIGVGAASTSLSVPQNAVIYEGDDARVWLARPDKTLAVRKIGVGRTDGGRVEVLSGLAAGDRVVDAGAIFIDRAATND